MALSTVLSVFAIPIQTIHYHEYILELIESFGIPVLSIIPVIPVAIKIFYPIYFKLDVTSCYEYLGIRFGSNIRVFGAMLYITQVSEFESSFAYSKRDANLSIIALSAIPHR